MQHVENDLDVTIEKLTQTTTKLDEKEKAYAVAEGEIQALKRKIALLEDELERSDSINKAIKVLETKNMIDEQRIEISENQLKEAKQMVEESDIKYDEVARKLAMVEDDLKRADSRAEYGEKTVQKLNLRVDSIITDLVQEKMKTQNVNDELDQTFELFVAN